MWRNSWQAAGKGRRVARWRTRTVSITLSSLLGQDVQLGRRRQEAAVPDLGRVHARLGGVDIGDLRRHQRQPRGHDLAKADRKSTRLNSSHSQISYAVFCLKKKKRIMHNGLTMYLSSPSWF